MKSIIVSDLPPQTESAALVYTQVLPGGGGGTM